MDQEQQHHSQLFTVRLWTEELGNGETEYRGKVQHVTSGETRHFRDWAALVAFLSMKMQAAEGEGEIGIEVTT